MRLVMPGAFVPSARAGAAAPSRARSAGKRSTRTSAQGALPRVRWDRLGRLAMLFVLAALLYLYLSAGIRMLSSWRQSRNASATVATMEREHKALVRERESLGRQGTIEAQARDLDMKKPNERQYIAPGLPSN
jgi:cell division protein FtsL